MAIKSALQTTAQHTKLLNLMRCLRKFCRDLPAIIATKEGKIHKDFCYTSALNRINKRSKSMGEIVAAFGVCHSPHLLTRPPDEVVEQSEASIGAMRQLGKLLDETK